MNDYKKQLQFIKDALAESVLESSDEEIIEEVRAEGKNPEKEAEKVKKVLLDEMEKFKSKKCTEKEKCMDWEKGMEQIIGAQMLAANHGIEYTGKCFRHCPWCGERIK